MRGPVTGLGSTCEGLTINRIEGYWAYAKDRLLRPHGVADEHFLLYLEETEYRFNHRDLDQNEFVDHSLSEVLLP